MNYSEFLKKNGIHLVALLVFFVATFVYFSPEFKGYSLKQHDVEQYKGMSNEIQHFREDTGEEPQWTNSMFGGMPAVQISMLYTGNIFQKATIGFLRTVGVPSGIFLLHLLGFYILALCLRIKPVIAILGAFAFAFASYEIIILQVGHNSKAVAVAYMAPVLGAFIMAYRHNWKWGVLLSSFFMTWEVSANHLQVTYYLGILLFFLGLHALYSAFKKKALPQFFKVTGLMVVGYGLALFINYGNITLTNDYAKQTIRGGNDVSINPDGSESLIKTSGLDKEYITNWSYGIGESFTFISPYVKGGSSYPLSRTHFIDDIESVDLNKEEFTAAQNMGVYWGDQPMVGGPVYLGVIVVLLAFLALFFLKDSIKWVYFGVSILVVALSWGKNFMGLTEFLIDYLPGYNKFRTVTIILVVLEMINAVMAVLFLQLLWKNRGELPTMKKKFLYASGGFLVFLLLVKFVGLGDNYSSVNEADLPNKQRAQIIQQINGMSQEELTNYRIDKNNPAQMEAIIDGQLESLYTGMDAIKKVRGHIFHSSMNRSILFSIVALIIVGLFFYTEISSTILVGALALFVVVDLVGVDLNYLSNDKDLSGDFKYWVEEPEASFPIVASTADREIMNMELANNPALASKVDEGRRKGTNKAKELGYNAKYRGRVVDSYTFNALNNNSNYRVYNADYGWSGANPSYFHKSLGGYHGAKLRNIQNLFEFHLSRSNMDVFNMLNVKYFIQGNQVQTNNEAMGVAWMVEKVKTFDSPDDEIRALGRSYSIENVGSGRLVVNEEQVKSKVVYGSESILYIENGDTTPVRINQQMRNGLMAYLVADAKGLKNYIPSSVLKSDSLGSFSRLVSIVMKDQFLPNTEALMLSTEAGKLSSNVFTGEGTVLMESYAPNHLTYKVNTKGTQLVVFSEIYYKDGWKAFVDGKEQEILKVNYLLRGLELESGNHKVEFKFDMPALSKSNMMSIVGTVILFGGLIFGFYWTRKKTSKVS